eukprot:963528-Rhodomonas_salina.3
MACTGFGYPGSYKKLLGKEFLPGNLKLYPGRQEHRHRDNILGYRDQPFLLFPPRRHDSSMCAVNQFRAAAGTRSERSAVIRRRVIAGCQCTAHNSESEMLGLRLPLSFLRVGPRGQPEQP